MLAKSIVTAAALLFAIVSTGCAPKETFSWIDRNCFVADWTNHRSCLSCCRNGPCGQVYPNVEYPMLVLGDPPTAEEVAIEATDDEFIEELPLQ